MSQTGIGFEISATDGMARLGKVTTAHGDIQTPAFMPVGTAAAVKAMMPGSVRDTGAEIILGNTYHLMLRPGAERVAKMGGLHKFMNWPGPILTDSGGYQVMSLSDLNKITEDGVRFRSHIDGSYHDLNPKSSLEIQRLLDANITMCFDQCPHFSSTPEQTLAAMELSMRWAARCREEFVERPGYGLFGIVQGGVDRQMRSQSVKALTDIGFDGYAVGGLAVGEGQELMFKTLDFTTPQLPADRPRYLMGVGKPSDIVGAVARGIDMFDCVLPTRSGRTAQAFTRRGALNLRNARHAEDPRPLDAECTCPTCTQFSRAYLHHVVKAGEIMASMLLSWHNLHYYQDIMRDLRAAIADGRLAQHVIDFTAQQARGDLEDLRP